MGHNNIQIIFAVIVCVLQQTSIANAQGCSIDGFQVILTKDLQDTDLAGTSVGVFPYVGVTTLTAADSPYLEVTIINDTHLEAKATAAFENYEKTDEIRYLNFDSTYSVECKGQTTPTTMTFKTQVMDSNNYAPEFDNPSYDFTLPSPFAPDLSLTLNYKEICATDYDISDINNDMIFSLESPDNRFKIETKEGRNKKSNCLNLVTSNWLLFSDGSTITLKVIAKNIQTDSPPATVTISIKLLDSKIPEPAPDSASVGTASLILSLFIAFALRQL